MDSYYYIFTNYYYSSDKLNKTPQISYILMQKRIKKNNVKILLNFLFPKRILFTKGFFLLIHNLLKNLKEKNIEKKNYRLDPKIKLKKKDILNNLNLRTQLLKKIYLTNIKIISFNKYYTEDRPFSTQFFSFFKEKFKNPNLDCVKYYNNILVPYKGWERRYLDFNRIDKLLKIYIRVKRRNKIFFHWNKKRLADSVDSINRKYNSKYFYFWGVKNALINNLNYKFFFKHKIFIPEFNRLWDLFKVFFYKRKVKNIYSRRFNARFKKKNYLKKTFMKRWHYMKRSNTLNFISNVSTYSLRWRTFILRYKFFFSNFFKYIMPIYNFNFLQPNFLKRFLVYLYFSERNLTCHDLILRAKRNGNVYLTLINAYGEVLFSISSGILKLKNKKQRRTRNLLLLMLPILLKKLKDLEIKHIYYFFIYLKNTKLYLRQIYWFVRHLTESFIYVRKVIFNFRNAHNSLDDSKRKKIRKI